MLRYAAPVTVPSKKNGPTTPLDDTPHQTESPGKFTALSTPTLISRRPAHTFMPVHCTIQLKRGLISPNNHVQELCILTNQDHLQLLHAINMARCISTQLLCESGVHLTWKSIPISLAHRLKDFFGDGVNCCNTMHHSRRILTHCPYSEIDNKVKILCYNVYISFWDTTRKRRFRSKVK